MVGLLRYSIEEVLYSTSPTEKKIQTHADEAKGVCKTVGKLLKRFEKHSQGEELEATLVSVVKEEVKDDKHLNLDGSSQPPSTDDKDVSVAETSFFCCQVSGYDSFRVRCETEFGRTSTPVTPRRFADKPVSQRRLFESPAQLKEEVVVEPVVKASPSQDSSSPAPAQPATRPEMVITPKRPQSAVLKTAQKPRPSSLGSNSSRGSDSSSGTDKSFSPIARKEVLAASAKFSKWETTKLRDVAVGAAQYRLSILETINASDRTSEVKAVMETYVQCILSAGNVALESLCLALVELNENVGDEDLTDHEKYVAYKFVKKMEQEQD